MPTLTIDISEAMLDALKRRAEQHGQTVEALVASELATAVHRSERETAGREPDPDVQVPDYAQAAEAVLSENADLYERLS